MKTLFKLLAPCSPAGLQAVPYDVAQDRYADRKRRAPPCRTPIVTITSAISFNAAGVTTVRGRITCADNGSAIPGLRVTVTFPGAGGSDTVVTDENGVYVAVATMTFPAGSTVTVSLSGGPTVTAPTTVAP
jgi:hypothetical protein